MARPIWKGHITFGLVNIPVTLFSAEKRNDLHFKLLDSRNHARVRYERVNEETGQEVPWNEIVRGFEYNGGDYVLLTDDDFKKAAVEATQSVEIEDFVDRDEIDPVYFDKPYYLVPGKKGDKGYVLLRETLKRTGKVGIAKVVIRTRQYLSAVIAEGDALVLALLRFDQELRKPEDFDLPREDLKEYKVSPKEIDMAEKLVETMSGQWQPEQYHDEYRDALMKWIEKKAKAGDKAEVPEVEEAAEEPAEVVDMMDLLKRSVEGGSGKKKTAAGKSSGKKKAASKSTAKRKKAVGE